MFTTSTIFASVLLFQGFNTGGAAAVSLLGGFFTTFLGVYLLNLNKSSEGDFLRRPSYANEQRRSLGARRPSEEHLHDSFELAPQTKALNQPFVLEHEENTDRSLPRFHDIPRPS